MDNGLGNPKWTRTRICPEPSSACTEMLTTKWIFASARLVPTGFRFRAPKFRPASTCSRSARSGVVRAGRGIGMPRPKRLEKLRIWEPGAASRAGARRASVKIPGAGEGAGRRNFRNPVFQKSGRWGIFIGGPLSTQRRPPSFKQQ